MLLRVLVLLAGLLLSFPALAGSVAVLPGPPLVADGQSVVRVTVNIPGLQDADKVRARPYEGELVALTRGGAGLVTLHLKPAERYKPGDLRVTLSVRGSMKLDEDINIPLLPPARGGLTVSFEPAEWKAGSGGTVKVTVRAEGAHPLPDSARSPLLAASEGKLSAPKANSDGSWSATWTPPTKVEVPTNVLFTATDATAPGRVQGYGALPMLVQKKQVVDAPAGSRNTLVLGGAQYGPATAGADGKVTFDALLDPRLPTATLQSVDATARRTDSVVDLQLGSPARMIFAPTAERVPAGAEVRLMLLFLQGDGKAWSGVAPVLGTGEAGTVEGKGWFSFVVKAPAAPGPWKIEASAEGNKATLAMTVIDSPPAMTLVADPVVLKPSDSLFSVTASLKDADGKALTGRKLTFSAQGAAPNGAPKDNGDGTYTQKFKLSGGAQTARVQVNPTLQTTGLPPAQLLVWARPDTLDADGKGTATLYVVAVDAFGMPVPSVSLNVTAPLGDGAIAPTATTDKAGLGVLSYRAGTQSGPAVVRVDTKGLSGTVTLWQGAAPAGLALDSGGDDTRAAALTRAQGGWGAVTVAKVGANVGPPAAVAVTTVPAYTTPGAAILVNIRVMDAQGQAVIDQTPLITATLGRVGAITNNGDGTYNVPLQLPPGQDGPVQIDVAAGSAKGSALLQPLASMGGAAAMATDGGGGQAGLGGSSGGGGGSSGGGASAPRPPRGGPAGGTTARVRLTPTVTAFRHGATAPGEFTLPTDASFLAVPVGLGASAEFMPGQGNLTLEARAKAGFYRVQVGLVEPTPFIDVVQPLTLGLRYRQPLSTPGMHWFVGGWGQLTDVTILRYADDARTNAELLNKQVLGLRVGGGLQIENDTANVRLELAETLAPTRGKIPWPVMTSAGVMVDLAVLPDNKLLCLGVDYDFQHMRFEVGEGEEIEALTVRSHQATALVGIGKAF